MEDPLDVNGQRGLVSDSSSRTLSTVGNSPVSATNGSSALLGKGNKLDPYYLIAHVSIRPLPLLAVFDTLCVEFIGPSPS